jgi:hypothetical protein
VGWKERIGRKLGWHVDESATMEDLMTDSGAPAAAGEPRRAEP